MKTKRSCGPSPHADLIKSWSSDSTVPKPSTCSRNHPLKSMCFTTRSAQKTGFSLMSLLFKGDLILGTQWAEFTARATPPATVTRRYGVREDLIIRLRCSGAGAFPRDSGRRCVGTTFASRSLTFRNVNNKISFVDNCATDIIVLRRPERLTSPPSTTNVFRL
ncbi:hypothetical protein GWI33_000207 [Rhynchophorus ferrugineus]|uniref:Uncharacterized protein n=1 Tax=Rhynchophorus ferrugineus TaxID=354439 RepID=A0A834IX63_RHYFE|nr:hypothetical protein GWI33_000207 [Rhynchophorus ferrugineus]